MQLVIFPVIATSVDKQKLSNHRCFENDTSGCSVFSRSVAAVRSGESEVKLMLGFGVLLMNSDINIGRGLGRGR